ncbi:hypothetical protein O6P43_010204 [Quillaja saponaria]|uniref:Uncharacterized protein n=1 Tax=Quillaja saponaria TaxID=32244 RepID=A0AAD7VE50_QUISA|nr:hypothetical protein O6P43_010204 [Quillaja saponaria]
MSSEGDSSSAPPFDTSDGYRTDGTIVPMGEEPKYRPRKGKVLPPSIAYHSSTSSSSKNTEYGSFEDEDEDTAMARFLPEQDGDEEYDDDVAIFWPQTNITTVNTIENIISDQKLEIARKRYFEPVRAKIYKVDPYRDRLNHSRQEHFLLLLGIPESRGSLSFPPFYCQNMGLTQEQEAAKVRAATRRRPREDATSSQIRSLAKEGKGRALLEGANRHRRLFANQGSGAHFLGRPGGCLYQQYPLCGLCHSEREHLAHGRNSDRRSSARESIYYRAVCRCAVPPIPGLLVHKLLGTIQENENLKAWLIQAKKVEAEERATSEHFESLQAKVLCLGAKVEGWLEKCREHNEDANRLREEVEWYWVFESEAVRLRGEKDEEIVRLRAELEVSKEEAWTVVENFKNFDDYRKMIYDHGSRLYANGWVGCLVWLKERNPSLDISEVKWLGEEEAKEEERLAKMLAEAKADKGRWI